MPLIYNYLPASESFLFLGAGVLSDEDLEAGMDMMLHDPNFRREDRVFFDLGGVEEFSISSRVMERLEMDKLLRTAVGKRAYLIFSPVGSTSFKTSLLQFGLRNLEIFNDRKAAYDWLNEGFPTGKHVSGGPSSWPFLLSEVSAKRTLGS